MASGTRCGSGLSPRSRRWAGERDALDEQRADVGSLLESARPEPQLVGADGTGDASVTDAPAADAARTDDRDVSDSAGDDSDARSAEARLDAPLDDEETTAEWLGVTPTDGSATVDGAPAADGDATDAEPAAGLDEVESIELTSGESEPAPAPTFERRRSIWGSERRDAESRDAAAAADTDDVFGDARSTRESSASEAEASSTTASSGKDAPGREAEDSFDELAFLRSVIDPSTKAPMTPRGPASDAAQKTLRCTECGTMNLPTEWYCERCGGELAAF